LLIVIRIQCGHTNVHSKTRACNYAAFESAQVKRQRASSAFVQPTLEEDTTLCQGIHRWCRRGCPSYLSSLNYVGGW